jgi:hypothetical protein
MGRDGAILSDLESLPPHRRSDGKLVRYVAPPAGAARWPAVPVSHIIFPRYIKGPATRLQAVSRSEALGRVMTECLEGRIWGKPNSRGCQAIGLWPTTFSQEKRCLNRDGRVCATLLILRSGPNRRPSRFFQKGLD